MGSLATDKNTVAKSIVTKNIDTKSKADKDAAKGKGCHVFVRIVARARKG